ncbi:MAG TPA: PspA/IM30 family protein [Bryobacteraceae bacterium]|nr:PspA/IM30 family protein [Bryobacteraceae bacterium]
MALLERVTTLIKANINDLVSKAEHPEKLLKQLLLDMENQLMQVKTQVALAVADQHLLENKQKDNLASQQDWVRKAELALNKGDEALARMALERSLTFETAAQNFSQQIEDQAHQVEMLKTALYRLEQKMAETRSKADLLITQHRRAKLSERAGTAALEEFGQDAAFVRMRNKVQEADAIGEGHLALAEESPEKRLEQLEKADKVEKLLENLKAQRH